MKAEFINPFLTATKNVLETMCQIKVQAQKPHLKADNKSFGEVSGIIGMASETVKGCMVVSFSEECILRVVGNMLYEDPKKTVDDEVVDAVGELTNMICGGAKSQLATMNHKFSLATPTMITGKGVAISYHADSPTLVIPFKTEYGDFVIEANLAEK